MALQFTSVGGLEFRKEDGAAVLVEDLTGFILLEQPGGIFLSVEEDILRGAPKGLSWDEFGGTEWKTDVILFPEEVGIQLEYSPVTVYIHQTSDALFEIFDLSVTTYPPLVIPVEEGADWLFSTFDLLPASGGSVLLGWETWNFTSYDLTVSSGGSATLEFGGEWSFATYDITVVSTEAIIKENGENILLEDSSGRIELE